MQIRLSCRIYRSQFASLASVGSVIPDRARISRRVLVFHTGRTRFFAATIAGGFPNRTTRFVFIREIRGTFIGAIVQLCDPILFAG